MAKIYGIYKNSALLENLANAVSGKKSTTLEFDIEYQTAICRLLDQIMQRRPIPLWRQVSETLGILKSAEERLAQEQIDNGWVSNFYYFEFKPALKMHLKYELKHLRQVAGDNNVIASLNMIMGDLDSNLEEIVYAALFADTGNSKGPKLKIIVS